jgi:hypothetical protein
LLLVALVVVVTLAVVVELVVIEQPQDFLSRQDHQSLSL